MKIALFSYRRALGLSDDLYYTDINQIRLKGRDRVIEEIKAFLPDVIIEEESNDGQAIYTDIYREFPHTPKAWWMIDAHITLAEHLNYAKQFSYVFCGQSWFQKFVQRETLARSFFLPLCHTQTDAEYLRCMELPKDRDIPFSFIGNIRSLHVERKRYVRKFLEMFGDGFFARQSDHSSTMDYLRRSVMTFNCSLNNDLNFRVWEAVAMGCQVVTDKVEDIGMSGIYSYLTLYDKLCPDFSVLQSPVIRYGSTDFILREHTLTKRYQQMIEMIRKEVQYGYA